MGEDRLDKFIKDKVFDHQTPANLDAIWQGIQEKQKVEEEPKRRWFIWFSLLAGLLLVGGLSTYAVSNSKADDNQGLSQSKGSPEPTNEVSTVNHSEQKPAGLTPNELTEEPVDLSRSPSENQASNSASLSSEQMNSASNEATNWTSTAADNQKGAKEYIPKTAIRNQIDEDLIVAPSQTEDKQSEQVNRDLDSEMTDTPSKTKTKNTTERVRTNISNLPRLTTLKLSKLFLTSGLTPSKPMTDLVLKPDYPSGMFIIPHKGHAPLSIGAHFSYGHAFSQLKNKPGFEEGYLNRRKELESPEQVLRAGIDLQYQFQSGLFFKSGLAYEQITERFNLNLTTAPEDFYNENAPNTIYQLADGTTEITYGTNSSKQRILNREIYNRYRSIDLPLSVGYSPKSKSRFHWFAEAGVLINLSFMPRGQILDSNEETIIDLSNTDILKSNIGLSLDTGIGLSYRMGRQWSIWLSPRFRYALSSMTTNDYSLDQSFTRAAIQIGVRRTL